MIEKLKRWGAIFTIIVGVGVVAAPAPAHAFNIYNGCSGNSSVVCQNSTKDSATNYIKIIINALLYIIGIVSVIMIIVGAFRYITSSGDASALTGAKNTIMYAIIGLVVAILAFVIVNFVITVVSKAA